jgi:hypothetical protein
LPDSIALNELGIDIEMVEDENKPIIVLFARRRMISHVLQYRNMGIEDELPSGSIVDGTPDMEVTPISIAVELPEEDDTIEDSPLSFCMSVSLVIIACH